MRRRVCGVSTVSTLFATHSAIFRPIKFYLFKFQIKYGKELRCLYIRGKYAKVTDTEIKWSIISKFVTIIIFLLYLSIN